MDNNNPLILVFYINIGNLDREDVPKYIEATRKSMTEGIKEDGRIDPVTFFIPIRDGDSRLECINPKIVIGEEFMKVKSILERLEVAVDSLANKAS